jgi:hypothetical protein
MSKKKFARWTSDKGKIPKGANVKHVGDKDDMGTVIDAEETRSYVHFDSMAKPEWFSNRFLKVQG